MVAAKADDEEQAQTVEDQAQTAEDQAQAEGQKCDYHNYEDGKFPPDDCHPHKVRSVAAPTHWQWHASTSFISTADTADTITLIVSLHVQHEWMNEHSYHVATVTMLLTAQNLGPWATVAS